MKLKITQPKTHTKLYIMKIKQSYMNTIKFTTLMMLGFLLITTSCSDDEQEVVQGLAIRLQSFDSRLSDEYSFSDINIRVYANKADWMAETNTLYSGKFDDTGVLFISSIPLEQDRDYYADIFSDDNVLSNLSVSINGVREYDYIFRTKPEGSFETQVSLETYPDIVGDWKFLNTSSSEASQIRFPVSINITKDFNVTVTDTTVSGSPIIREFKICRTSGQRVDGKNRGQYPLLVNGAEESRNACTDSGDSLDLDVTGILTSRLFSTSRSSVINYTR